eukprot:jgi/Botrbrau1/15259/Bobra.0382s0001.1
MDIEWRVTFKAGQAPRKAALLQLCYRPVETAVPVGQLSHSCGASKGPVNPGGDLTCLLLHIAYSGITPALARILMNQELLKVGVGILQDAQKLWRDYGVECNGLCCLSEEANLRLASSLSSFSKWSLAGLVQEVLQCQLPKDPQVRVSDWEARPLSRAQLSYAAADAAASLLSYQALMAMEVRWKPPPLPCAPLEASLEDGVEALCHMPASSQQARLPPAKAWVYERFTEGFTVESIAAPALRAPGHSAVLSGRSNIRRVRVRLAALRGTISHPAGRRQRLRTAIMPCTGCEPGDPVPVCACAPYRITVLPAFVCP